MASNSLCTSCLYTLRTQVRHSLSTRTPLLTIASSSARRTLTSTTPLNSTTPNPPQPTDPRQPPPPPPKGFNSLAASLRTNKTLRSTTEPLVAYGVTEALFHECAAQATYTIPSALSKTSETPRDAEGQELGVGEGWWFEPATFSASGARAGGLGLDVTFADWAQVMFLHLYMLTARLRAFPAKQANIWQRNLLEHFFYAAEDRMAVWHGMSSRGLRNRYLKDLWAQWRGVLVSYDEGVIGGDAVLAGAVWRNVFKGRVGDEVRVGDVAVVVAYLRREMRRLDRMGDEGLAGAEVKFGDPRGLWKVVGGERSKGVEGKFVEESSAEMTGEEVR